MAFEIPLYKSFHTAQDAKAVAAVIERGMGWADGEEIGRFEKNLCEYTGRKYAAAFSSGTSALHAMLLACGIGRGDEVIVPSFTFISTANSVLFCGAKPVFADIERQTLGLDAKDVEKRITQKTKAIMPIHYAGCPASQIESLRELANKRGLPLLEDNAESLGASIDGRKTGTFGEAAMLSFCANKIITCGEGGAVLTDSQKIYKQMRLLRSHGRAEGDYFGSSRTLDYVELGYNYRMPTMCAALADSQLGGIERIVRMRREVARAYRERLAGIDGVGLLPDNGRLRNIYQLFTIILPSRNERDGLRARLEKAGVQSKVYFEPAHATHFYRQVQKDASELPATEEMSGRVLSLPMFVGLSPAEIETICDEIEKFMKHTKG
ncbi:UDP-4-amino-4-deoxy-L-arabinose--oxoglutarate aminotransferase [uncultured archaeon]|nr:UDP-4-amino-4-deoxy-L-arabinose--oxoglutarate aminotransferase [uncultured archaeon]